jgi:hypothetical protein
MDDDIIETDFMEIDQPSKRVGGLAGSTDALENGLSGRKETLERVENYELPWYVHTKKAHLKKGWKSIVPSF